MVSLYEQGISKRHAKDRRERRSNAGAVKPQMLLRLLAWQRNGLTAGSQDSTLKADRIGGLSDGTPKEAEQAKNLDPPQPYPQAVDQCLHIAKSLATPPHVTGVEVSSVLIAENTLILSPKGWSEGKRSGEGERRVSYQRKKAKGYPLWRGPFAF